ncbi:unnamed protein product [Paramecium sonneborni]|uniref:Uncharacterized protein n=1 Tax=Paramecium sonneborni TaxID=65129 RepID=A0A8S1ML61_9CILI|nr:unnamed protein product [Paramecium sonneborni]
MPTKIRQQENIITEKDIIDEYLDILNQLKKNFRNGIQSRRDLRIRIRELEKKEQNNSNLCLQVNIYQQVLMKQEWNEMTQQN